MPWIEQHGDSWLVRVRHGRCKFTDSCHRSERVARQRLLQLLNLRLLATAARPGAAPTLAHWATQWLRLRLIAPETLENYRSFLQVHLLPELGHKHLDQIDRPAVLQLATTLGGWGLSPITVRATIGLLGTLLRDAIRAGYLAQDPTSGIRIHRPLAATRPVLSAGTVQTIADHMPTERMRALVITAAFTGLRPGESAALQAHNLHPGDARSLGLPYLYIDPDHGGRHEVRGRRWLGHLKTRDSARHVFLPVFLYRLLTDLAPTTDGGLLFTLQRDQLLARQQFSIMWRQACHRADHEQPDTIDPLMRFYQLRHNHRAWMDEDTIDEDVQATRLGHRHSAHRLPLRRLAALQQPLLDALEQRWRESVAERHA